MGGDALGVRPLISDDFSPENSFFLTEVIFILEIRKVLRKSFHLLSSCHVEELSPKVETLTFSSFRNNTENEFNQYRLFQYMLDKTT